MFVSFTLQRRKIIALSEKTNIKVILFEMSLIFKDFENGISENQFVLIFSCVGRLVG